MNEQKSAYIKRSIQTLTGSITHKDLKLTVLKTIFITPNNFKITEDCSRIINPKNNILVKLTDQRIDKFNAIKKATFYHVALNNILFTDKTKNTELNYQKILDNNSELITNIELEKEYTIFEKTYNNDELNDFWTQYKKRL